ncbi:MAG: hypothetical protein DRP91_00715 [Candidatus Neomarinimicrobiota bacterium]|nr:MAG: hypothetical protein DRP91_00715 [Candidatus Neomarinimicrobiota bacterium]
MGEKLKSRAGISALIFVFVFQSWLNCKPYRGGELRTIRSFLYGRFEVRFKSARGSGIVSSFFTFYDNVSSLDDWNEIDIEVLGRYEKNVQFNTITPGREDHVELKPLSFSPHDGFHVYAIEWTPNYVAWYVDSVQLTIQVGEHIAQLNKPQKIMMNLWQPTAKDWAGEFSDTLLPRYAVYDWVRYYRYDPENGNYGWGNKFSFEWEDNFDYFDTQRWQKATHTFEGNNCDFIPDNVVFKDGFMILCLTTPENPGYSWIDENDLFCDGFELLNAYPNPFNSHLNIALNVKKESDFQISIYDLCGNLVNEVYNNYLCLGQHILQFNGMDRYGKDIHSGMYILRIDSNYGTVRKKVTFLK